MGTSFVLTTRATLDIDEILEHVIENDGRRRAGYVADRLHESFLKLSAYPRIGQLRTDLADVPLRIWVVLSFLVIYQPDSQPLQILRVIHGSRDIERLMADWD